MITSHEKFYVYVHMRADNGKIFYVGKGTGGRAWSKYRNAHWRRIVEKHDYTIRIVAKFYNEYCAYSFERALVKRIGLENLSNIYPGGSYEMEGFNIPKDTRNKISIGRKGERHWNYGKSHSPDTIKSMLGHGSNQTEYNFTHIDGDKFIGTTNDLKNKYSLSRSDGTNLRHMALTGRYSHVKGWSIYNG